MYRHKYTGGVASFYAVGMRLKYLCQLTPLTMPKESKNPPFPDCKVRSMVLAVFLDLI